jgi:hypothetical protein
MTSYSQFVKRSRGAHHPQPVHKRKTAANKNVKIPTLLDYPIDTDLATLIINDELVSDDLSQAILDGKIIETMEGAASLELNIEDSSRVLVHKLLKDWVSATAPRIMQKVRGKSRPVMLPVTWNEVYATLDGRDFCLVACNKAGDEFTLTFENRAVHELRRYKKHKSWTRTATFTRAMAIKAMCDEVTTLPGGVGFFSTELHTTQPIGNLKQLPSSKQTKAIKGRGFAPNAPVTVKHAKASPQQRDYIAQVLTTGDSMKMPYAVQVSAIMCITQESTVTILNNPTLGMGLFSQEKYIGGARSQWPAMDHGIPGDARAYFNVCIRSYRSNPSQSLADLVQSVQHSGAGASYYAQWESEAKNTLKQWGTTEGSSSVSYTEYNAYAFTRGVPGQTETSWDAIQRLAKEVNFRAFMLDNTMYYEDDNTLIDSIPFDTISESTEGIDTIDYDIDTGKTVSECTVTAHFNRWQAPPGCVIVVEDSGPITGRWLVYQVERPLFSNVGTITLHIAQPPLPEPAPSTSQVTIKGDVSLHIGKGGKISGSGNSQIDKVYNKAIDISKKGYPYVYAGGHNAAFSPPYDCSGYVSAILHAGGMVNTAMASGGFDSWGDPGQGKVMTIWTNPNPGESGHVFIEFKLPHPIGHVQANTSHSGIRPGVGAAVIPWGGNGLADSRLSTFHPRHWPGT